MIDSPPETPPVEPQETPPVDEPKEDPPPPPPAAIQGGGAATTEVDELRERVRLLETGMSRAPVEPVRRMVPMPGFLDQHGKPIMVPAPYESAGEKIMRQQYNTEIQDAMARARALREVQAEAWRAEHPGPEAEPTTEPWSSR